MARKGWDQLSPAYRSRLERGGITAAGYRRGDSLSAARGHASKADLVRQVQKLKYDLYGNRESFNRAESDRTAKVSSKTNKDWTVRELTGIKETLSGFLAGSEPGNYDEYWNDRPDDYSEAIFYH